MTDARNPQPQTERIHRAIGDDNVCVLTFDRPASSANIFDRATLEELGGHLDFIELSPQLKGVVFISAKRAIFIAGLDLRALEKNVSISQVRGLVELGQNLFNRIAALKIPTVAAIHGAAAGGGCELALACDYRVASDDRATKIGLPETRLGLLPAWGGSTRLPRRIGLPAALDIILGGKTVVPQKARRLGLVDEVVPVEYLGAAAAKKIRRGKRPPPNHWAANNPLSGWMMALRVRSQLLKKTRGHYPAVLKALDVAVKGASTAIPASLALERDAILELAQTEASRNLIRVFFLQERARKRAEPAEAAPIARAAVIGAGVMGAGIAQWLGAHGLQVILRDINVEQVGRGMAGIAAIYREGVKRHLFTPREARDGMDRIFPAPEESPLRRAGIVIEAAVENMDLKRKIFERLDALAGEDTILATNTSALPISELATATRRPERVVGLHFFNPVHRMQLVEIVAAPSTAPEVVQRSANFARRIGKLPVIVKDSPGFLVNRVLMPWLIEAANLFEAGANLQNLDEAMLDFGMPMGPMRLVDEVGVDVALLVARTLAGRFSDRLNVPAVLVKMNDAKMLGRKNGRGFYLHGKSREPRPNPETAAFVRDRKAAAIPTLELQERMVFLMVNEAARCVEEKIAAEPADVDFAMIMGAGFAPFRGGPLRFADSLGPEKIAGAMQNLVDCGNPHFAPCDLLKSLAAAAKKFYSD
ncbi:MAG: enoyl-CoA hydratase/isomerase family protein [Verrucomicrobiota bacterium]|nr:enoyl-CoA hydratase/isomerase family protein [Verrucomicrobiota bacterium]